VRVWWAGAVPAGRPDHLAALPGLVTALRVAGLALAGLAWPRGPVVRLGGLAWPVASAGRRPAVGPGRTPPVPATVRAAWPVGAAGTGATAAFPHGVYPGTAATPGSVAG
jgi:hypothetical protein